MFNHWLIAVCALTFYIIPHGGESAFRPRVSFTSLAFQASTFANSVTSPYRYILAEGAGYDPADAVADATGVRDRRNYSVSAIPP